MWRDVLIPTLTKSLKILILLVLLAADWYEIESETPSLTTVFQF